MKLKLKASKIYLKDLDVSRYTYMNETVMYILYMEYSLYSKFV